MLRSASKGNDGIRYKRPRMSDSVVVGRGGGEGCVVSRNEIGGERELYPSDEK